jgi:diguanylate cyclase (GGDEF)-like protein
MVHRRFSGLTSISTKLRVIILTICGLVLLFSTVAATLYTIYSGRQDLRQKVLAMTEIAANQSAAALMFEDAVTAAENLKSLQAAPEVEVALLRLPDNRKLAAYRRAPEVKEVSCPQCANDGIHWLEKQLHSVQTIRVDGNIVGRLVLQVSLEDLHRQTTSFVALSLLMLLAAMAAASALATWMQRSITRPVEELSEGMQHVARTNDYSIRVPRKTEDELGRLTDGFNAMLGQIESQEKELARHREELEMLVEQRTRELKVSMDKVQQLAFFDELTGLANRLLFKERVDLVLGHARQQKDNFAILFLDLDRFKRINDSFGHHIGDMLLKEIARRLLACLRTTDMVSLWTEELLNQCVSRQGGDEFILLLSELKTTGDAARVANRIIKAISQPIQLEGYELVSTTSIGIAVYPDDGTTVDQLLKNADAAMYHAKKEGRNNYQFFRDTMHESSIRRLSVETELRHALEQKQLRVVYQPLIDLAENRVYGAEALVRWSHPRLGNISPVEFIPVAEECDLIGPLTGYMLDQVGRHLARWRDMRLPSIQVSVNVSGARFGQQRLVEMTRRVIRTYGLTPQQLILELTEYTLMTNRQETLEILLHLQREGVGIAIDDFGTGYSSLAYLKSFPIDTLKIDKSFVDEVATDPNDQAIVRAIIALARSLELEVIAEGVETEEQRGFLLNLGCYRFQGYLYGRPMPPKDFEEFLATAKPAL